MSSFVAKKLDIRVHTNRYEYMDSITPIPPARVVHVAVKILQAMNQYTRVEARDCGGVVNQTITSGPVREYHVGIDCPVCNVHVHMIAGDGYDEETCSVKTWGAMLAADVLDSLAAHMADTCLIL